ncbi:MAG: asparagine synthase (glutamine-hydrolyzing) [Cyanobium sp.]
MRHRLEASGHRFASQSDTETIVHLYEDLGTDCFKHFNGMVAIAIWDSTKDRLILARDRLGKKPLFYWHDTDRLFFASELKALRRVSGFPQEIDYNAIDAYLTYQYIPHPMTIYKGVHKLPPGHFLILENGRLEIQPYWDIDWSHEAPMSLQQAKSELRQRLTAAVERRLRSDVPLGAFLSGGIDSSLVCAIAQKMLQTPLRTFAIGFSEADFDETQYAASVAKQLGTEHQRFEVQPDAVGILDALVDHYDEPFSDSSAVPTWYLCELTRKSVTVALSGDGGDELFGGYNRHRLAPALLRRFGPWPPRCRASLACLLERLPASRRGLALDKRRKLAQALRSCSSLDALYHALTSSWADPLALLQPGWAAAVRSTAPPDAALSPLPSAASAAEQLMLADSLHYLPDDILTKVDRAAMAASLETRAPFLDHRVAAIAWQLPLSLKLGPGRSGSKWALRQLLDRHVPRALLERPKAGFAMPIGPWLRGPLRAWAADLLDASLLQRQGYLQPAPIQRLWQDHLSGRHDHTPALWTVLMWQAWLQQWQR